MSTLLSNFLFRFFGLDLKNLEKFFEDLSTYRIPREEQVKIQNEAIALLLKEHGDKTLETLLDPVAEVKPDPMPYLLRVLLNRAGWIASDVFSTYINLSASYWQLYTAENPIHRLLVNEHYLRPEGVYFDDAELVTLIAFTGEWLKIGPLEFPIFREVYGYNDPPLLVIPAKVEGLVDFSSPVNRWLKENLTERVYTLLAEKFSRPLFGRNKEELKVALIASSV